MMSEFGVSTEEQFLDRKVILHLSAFMNFGLGISPVVDPQNKST